MTIQIVNHGVGPAILTSIKLIDSKTKERIDSLSAMIHSEGFPENIGCYVISPINLEDEKSPLVVSAGEGLCIFSLDETPTLENKKDIVRALNRIQIEVEYTNMYRIGSWTLRDYLIGLDPEQMI